MLIVPRPGQTPSEAARPRVTWDESPCPQCAGRYWTPLIEAQDPQAGDDGLWFAVVQCDSCGTCFTNPRPDRASSGQFHNESDIPRQTHHSPRERSLWHPARWLKRPPVDGYAVPRQVRGRLLDFGCGAGGFLAEMHRRGWQVTGIDASARNAEWIRDELRLTAYCGTLPHLELHPESFDLITMWHSLHQVHEPMPVLREARDLLSPGGKLVVAVPNIDSLPFRWFGRHWCGLDLPRHLTHFTPTSLQQMLQRCGFTTESVRGVRRGDWLRRSAKLACSRRPNPPVWQWALTFHLPAFAFAWWCDYMGQTDCMIATAYR